MNHPYQALALIIEHCQPKAIAALGALGQSLAEHWSVQHPACDYSCLEADQVLTHFAPVVTPDLVLVTDVLEQLDLAQGVTLLGQLRNYGSHQIAVLVADDCGWTLTDFIGLGFQRHAIFTQGLTLYTYNIDSYNHKREWNNPRFWANPEMWGKAWW